MAEPHRAAPPATPNSASPGPQVVDLRDWLPLSCPLREEQHQGRALPSRAIAPRGHTASPSLTWNRLQPTKHRCQAGLLQFMYYTKEIFS
jgi:hypothetical protein